MSATSRHRGHGSRRGTRFARFSPAGEPPHAATRASRAALPGCTTPSKVARRASHERSLGRPRNVPRLRLRLRRHHGRGAAWPGRRGAAGVRAGRRVVRGRPGSRRNSDAWEPGDARTSHRRGGEAAHGCGAAACLSRRRHFLRSTARRGSDRRSAQGSDRQPRRYGRGGPAGRAAPRTRGRTPGRAAPARRSRGVRGGGPRRALSALRGAVRRGRRRARRPGGEKEPPRDRGGRGRGPRAGGRGWPGDDPAGRRARCARRHARDAPGATRADRRAGRDGDRSGPRDDHGALRGARRRRGARPDAFGPGPRGSPDRAGAGPQRPDALRPLHAPGRRQPLGSRRRAHVAAGVPVRGGLRARVPDLPAARRRGRAAGAAGSGRGARDRRAGNAARCRCGGARRHCHGRDRAAGEHRGLEPRRRGGHRSRRHPRGRHRVPDGRRAVAAAAGPERVGRAQRGGHGARAARAAGRRRVTTPARLRIAGGTVYDPAHGVDGVVRDVCIEGGHIVAELPAGAPRLDVRGVGVMPGGVDIHAHVAGASVNHARRPLPEEHTADPLPPPPLADGPPPRSGTGGAVPSTVATGYRYAGLGYTTAMEAAVAPLAARQAHAELDDTPLIDSGFFVLLGNDDYLLRQIAAGEAARARDYAAWLLGVTRAYAIKIVNPGGVAVWKDGGRNVGGLDDAVGSSAVTPRKILETLAGAANALALPHAVHIHCNNLGQAGNVATTLESMRALAGQRAHFTHLQFHSYGGGGGKGGEAGARERIEDVNGHPELGADRGQVAFGPATTVTADGPVEHLLYASSGRKWVNVDIELETGCGIVPYSFREKAAVAALQWAVGAGLFLLAKD